MSRLSGVSRNRIFRGLSEQKTEQPQLPEGRVHKPDGGRKKEVDKQIVLRETIEKIVSPHTMGNPCNPLIWSSKSLRHIKSALYSHGYSVSHEVIRQELMSLGYSLQSNKKTKRR